jgi:hypothetical protein
MSMSFILQKISRHPPFLKYGRQQPSTSAQALQQQQQLDDNNSKMSISSKHSAIEQETESGSGSIGSQQPSYRYLTVRGWSWSMNKYKLTNELIIRLN